MFITKEIMLVKLMVTLFELMFTILSIASMNSQHYNIHINHNKWQVIHDVG